MRLLKILEHSLQKRQMGLRWRPPGDGQVGHGGMSPHHLEWPPLMGDACARAAGTCSPPNLLQQIRRGLLSSQLAAHTYRFPWAIKTVPRGEAGGGWAPR